MNIDSFELIAVEGSLESVGETLAIYRLKQDLVNDGVSFGSYYLYFNPFTVTVELVNEARTETVKHEMKAAHPSWESGFRMSI